MSDYPLIAEHGMIGDLQTCALVATDGSIDWFCAPRFDSPSIFGALLDHRKGGHFRVHPAAGDVTTKQLYFPDTAVLVTRFLTEEGVGEVVDFMPVHEPTTATDRHRIVRMVRCVRGRMTFDIEVAPRFDYGREQHQTHLTDDGVVFESRAHVDDAQPRQGARRTIGAPTCSWTPRVTSTPRSSWRPARCAAWSWRPARRRRRAQVRVDEVRRLFDETVHFWESWLAQSTYEGRWRETMNRSAITLKLMTYAPTGALVAAPTAGLPEQVGGERNWDYRFTWVRDASFSVYALHGAGLRRRGRGAGTLAARPGRRAGGTRRLRAAPDHVPRRRVQRPHRGGPRPLGGLPALEPGADRQRGVRPAPARHLRRGGRQHLLPGHARARGRPRRLAEALARSSTGSRTTGTSPRRASGRPAAAARTSPTAG